MDSQNITLADLQELLSCLGLYQQTLGRDDADALDMMKGLTLGHYDEAIAAGTRCFTRLHA